MNTQKTSVKEDIHELHDRCLSIDDLLGINVADLNEKELCEYLARLKKLRNKNMGQVLEDEAKGCPEYQGHIYILSNSAMPGLLKIGATVGLVGKRAKMLHTTGVPEPFKVEKAFPVYQNPKDMENKVHRALNLFRSTQNREFFRLSVEYAASEIEIVLAGPQLSTI